MIVLATTTWNSITVIETFLAHYRKLGIDRVMVMDFDSTDGTVEALTSAEWQGFVERVPYPGIAGLDSSNIFLSRAKRKYDAGTWCLFCDPDELLITSSMTVNEAQLLRVLEASDLVTIPRFNVTGPLSIARADRSRLSALGDLTLRIDRRCIRDIAVDITRSTLDPPWIFTAIPGKVLVRLDATASIGDGDHTAVVSSNAAALAPEGMYLLHYPLRSFGEFQEKIRLATIDFAANADLPPHYGWQIRRWLELSKSGRLYDEYLQQFIRDEDLDRMVGDGTLALDQTVRIFNQETDAPRPATKRKPQRPPASSRGLAGKSRLKTWLRQFI
jgi:hypothetical protein